MHGTGVKRMEVSLRTVLAYGVSNLIILINFSGYHNIALYGFICMRKDGFQLICFGTIVLKEYVCGDKGVNCSWGQAINVANRYVYVAQPHKDRVLVISKIQMVVVDVSITIKLGLYQYDDTRTPSVSLNKNLSVKAQQVYFNIGYFKNRLYIIECKTHTDLGRTNNPLQPSGHYMYHQFNIQQFYVLPTQCIYVFCVDLRTNSDYFPIQH